MIVTLMAAGLLMAQTTTPSPPPVLDLELPPVAGLTASPTCGGREAMASIATCFVTTQAGAEGAVDVWNAAFAEQGWLAADGRDNRILYIRRKDGGGCDAFQLLVFADDMQIEAPAAPAYFALTVIPSDVCAAAIAAPASNP